MPSQQENKGRKRGGEGGRAGGGGGGRTHTEKTRCFPASPCDGRQLPTNKSEAAKRQDAEKGIRSDATPHSVLLREGRRVGNVGADARTHRGRGERDGPGLI